MVRRLFKKKKVYKLSSFNKQRDRDRPQLAGETARSYKEASKERGLPFSLGGGGKRLKLIILISLLSIAVIATGFFLAYYLYSYYHLEETYSIRIEEGAAGEFDYRINEFMRENPRLKVAEQGEEPYLIVDSRRRQGYSSSIIKEVPPLVIEAGEAELTAGEVETYYLLFKRRDSFVSGLGTYLAEGRREVTFTACGDVIPARNSAERMFQHGIYYPFERVAPYLAGSDIVCADLECPLSDRVDIPLTGMYFVSPTSTIEGIKSCGINLVSLANNHSTNFGRNVFTDTLEVLRANGMTYVGGGWDYEESYGPVFMEVKGVKFAFLSYNSIFGAVDATETIPGVAGIQLDPQEGSADYDLVSAAVSRAKQQADVVIVFFHWGTEEVYYPSDSAKRMAHTACDSGADLVVGTHPHSVQPLEYYDGKLIAYSLGNFVFDQMYSTQVREGVIMKCGFSGDDLSDVQLVPYKVYDFCQPVVLEGSSGQFLLDHLLQISDLSADQG